VRGGETPRLITAITVLGGSVKPRLIASLAVGAAVVLGTTGCSMLSTQATSIPYSAAEGVNVWGAGPLEVRNALIVANEEGSEGNFVAAIVNTTDENQTLNIDFDNGEDVIEATVRVPANSVVSLGTEDTEPLLIEDLNTLPGSDIAAYFQSGDAEGTLVTVPVLDGGLAYLEPLVP
jgi:hypothetical protein